MDDPIYVVRREIRAKRQSMAHLPEDELTRIALAGKHMLHEDVGYPRIGGYSLFRNFDPANVRPAYPAWAAVTILKRRYGVAYTNKVTGLKMEVPLEEEILSLIVEAEKLEPGSGSGYIQ